MNKDLLHRIVSSGFVRGVCDRAVLYFDSRNLYCEFISEDQVLTGRVMSEKFNEGNNFIGEGKIGLPSIDSFLKILKTLGDDVTAEVQQEGRNEKYLVLGDGVLQMKYGLIIDSQMPKVPRIKPLKLSKEFISIDSDKEFIGTFHKLSGAVKDCKYMFVQSDGQTVDLILSQSEDFETGVKLSYDANGVALDQTLKFNIKIVRGVLYNNRKADKVEMRIHPYGLIEIQAKSENIIKNYYILKERL